MHAIWANRRAVRRLSVAAFEPYVSTQCIGRPRRFWRRVWCGRRRFDPFKRSGWLFLSGAFVCARHRADFGKIYCSRIGRKTGDESRGCRGGGILGWRARNSHRSAIHVAFGKAGSSCAAACNTACDGDFGSPVFVDHGRRRRGFSVGVFEVILFVRFTQVEKGLKSMVCLALTTPIPASLANRALGTGP